MNVYTHGWAGDRQTRTHACIGMCRHQRGISTAAVFPVGLLHKLDVWVYVLCVYLCICICRSLLFFAPHTNTARNVHSGRIKINGLKISYPTSSVYLPYTSMSMFKLFKHSLGLEKRCVGMLLIIQMSLSHIIKSLQVINLKSRTMLNKTPHWSVILTYFRHVTKTVVTLKWSYIVWDTVV